MLKTIKVGSDFSGVGAFNQALIRLGIKYDEIFACDMDKYARQTFELNYGPINYFPKDVYEREIPKESLDIYMTSPPCQAFSLAGKRLGKEDKRGILFFNSLEFIQENKPRFFIFENVKGLLSHDKIDKSAAYGRTFQEWINYLGGKSVNGVHTFFPVDDSVPYHIYFQVLNAKHYGIPQNRERVFIIGIRDDEDNDFQFPKPFPLEKRLKDVLESAVNEKYFLSDKMINVLQHHQNKIVNTENPKESATIHAGYFKMGGRDQQYVKEEKQIATNFQGKEYSNTIRTGGKGSLIDKHNWDLVKIGTWRTHEDSKGFRATEDNNCPTIPARAREDGSGQPVIIVNQINPSLESGGKQPYQHNRIYDINGLMTTLDTDAGRKNILLPYKEKLNVIEEFTCNCGEVYIGNIETPCPKCGDFGGYSNELTTVQKDNVVVIQANNSKGFDIAEEEEDSINFSNLNSETRRGRVGKKVSQTLDTACNQGIYTQQRIRRLTPLECFRLMDFNFGIPGVPDFKWEVSDSQAYKQAGNSICVGVLAAIIEKFI